MPEHHNQKMKLLLSTLQLASLCALSSWSVSSQMVVTQSEYYTVVEGGSVNITCCWTVWSERARVMWTNSKTEVKNELFNYTNTAQNRSSSCSLLTLTNLKKDQSDTYFCKVQIEIPVLNEIRGNGTVITVLSKDEPEKQKEEGKPAPPPNTVHFILIALAVAAPVLLTALVCFCYRYWKRDRAARVIYEVPHFDSETQDMDKRSTGSNGSSQWCQVPVYESFDYFEQVETKKSG